MENGCVGVMQATHFLAQSHGSNFVRRIEQSDNFPRGQIFLDEGIASAI
jgi:hypothetical protein